MNIYGALRVAVLLVVLIVVFFANSQHKYINYATGLVIILEAIFIIGMISIASYRKNALLSFLLFNYIVWWFFRYATLSLLPDYSITLERTININQDSFYFITIVIFGGIVSSFLGGLIGTHLKGKQSSSGFSRRPNMIPLQVSAQPYILYALLGIIVMFFAVSTPADSMGRLFRYVYLFFDGYFVVFIIAYLIHQSQGVTKKLSLLLAIMFIVVTAMSGNRSGILSLVIAYIGVGLILCKELKFKIGLISMFKYMVLLMITIIIFQFGTNARHIRGSDKSNISIAALDYAVSKSLQADMTKVEPLIGHIAARFGFLDFSSEMIVNKKYGDVVNFENILISIIDNHIPGKVFKDSDRIASKLRGVYSVRHPSHTDAIGAVGENYILFGYGYLIVMAFVTFIAAVLYRMARSIFIKYVVLITFGAWWNSFGYDWIVIEATRKIVFGLIVFKILSLMAHWRVPKNHIFIVPDPLVLSPAVNR